MDPEACLSNCELFGKSAEYFESHVVPLWQDAYESLVARSGARPASKVLDVGTGTGEVALRMSKVVGKEGLVVGVDTIDEMLEIARRKAKALGADNLRLDNMSAEKLDLPDSSFDFVVGSYSLCCVMDYKAALNECLRVLRPGGRLTYNHSGLGDPLEYQIVSKIFEKYQTKVPSDRLRQTREADVLQNNAVEKYRDPSVTLNLMRSVGFQAAEATLTLRTIRYSSPEAYLDRLLAFDLRNEAAEIPNEELAKFRSESLEALAPLSKGPELAMRDVMVFFTGLKA
ncbi:MAG: class I SAM-dependent methyltransferase [Thaumarchaeota archaeon]|nr:class I SAM-dependent methyltransferase [Nitrososphaerota archaeon]